MRFINGRSENTDEKCNIYQQSAPRILEAMDLQPQRREGSKERKAKALINKPHNPLFTIYYLLFTIFTKCQTSSQ